MVIEDTDIMVISQQEFVCPTNKDRADQKAVNIDEGRNEHG